jgi:hypothetical protein
VLGAEFAELVAVGVRANLRKFDLDLSWLFMMLPVDSLIKFKMVFDWIGADWDDDDDDIEDVDGWLCCWFMWFWYKEAILFTVAELTSIIDEDDDVDDDDDDDEDDAIDDVEDVDNDEDACVCGNKDSGIEIDANGLVFELDKNSLDSNIGGFKSLMCCCW